MHRKYTGALRHGTGIDPRRVVFGLFANRFRFNSDPNAGGDAGAGGGSDPSGAAGSDDKGKGDQGGKAKTAEQITAELEDTRKALAKANKDAADHRKKLDAFEAAERAKADAEKSEADKLKERADKAEAAATAAASALALRDINDAIKDAARDAGFIDLSDALQLVDRKAIALADGKVTGAADAVKALAKAKAHLIKAADGKDKSKPGTPLTPKPGSGNGNGNGQPNPNQQQPIARSARM